MTRGRGRANRPAKRRAGQQPADQLQSPPSENVDPNQQNPGQQEASAFCACKQEVIDPENAAAAIGTINSIETPVIKMEHTDWQMKKDLVSCTSFMLKEEIHTDVSFSVGKEGTLIKAHKLLLAMRSPVFERMFFGAFPEAQNPIPIPDVEPAAFRNLLTYVYSDNAGVLLEDSLVTMYVAKKYMVTGLEEAARNCLTDNLSIDNLWEAYTYSLQWEDDQLLSTCEEYILSNAETVAAALNSKYFLEVPQSVVLEITKLHCPEKVWKYNGTEWKAQAGQVSKEESELPYHVLYISDIELFKVCNNWASAECLREKIPQSGTNKRKVLGDCLNYIQFPLMLPSDIANIVSPSGILTRGEVTSLFIHLLPSPQNVPLFKPGTQRLVLSVEGSPPSDHFSSTDGSCESKLHIRSNFRLLLSKIWVSGAGGPMYYIPTTIQVSLIDKAAGSVLLKLVKTKINDRDFGDNLCPLGHASFEPMVLKEKCTYIISVKHSCHKDKAIECGSPDESEEIPLSHLAHSETDLSVTAVASNNNCIAAISVSFV